MGADANSYQLRGFENKLTAAVDWSWDRVEGPHDVEVTMLTQKEALTAVGS
jgi:hypothetical protein